MRECFSCAGRDTDGSIFPGKRKPRCHIDLCEACLKGDASAVAGWAVYQPDKKRNRQARAKFRAAMQRRLASSQGDLIDLITPRI